MSSADEVHPQTDVQRIPGTAIDPPPKNFESTAQLLHRKHAAAGIMFRAGSRYVLAKAPLLAAGTTYYLFLSLISLVAFGYGIVALLGADQLAVWLTDALNNAFPGLIGEEGVSPDSIRGYGTTASIIGLLIAGYAGTSSINAASQSLHLIYGAPKNPRNIAIVRTGMLGQLMVLGPLILLSYVPSLLISSLTEPIVERLGLESVRLQWLLIGGTLLLSILLNYAVIHLLLGRMGGIRPPERALRIGSAVGAVLMEALKYAAAGIIAWSLSKPQYGASAVPITFMLVLYLQSSALYAAAALTAAVAVSGAAPQESGTGAAAASEAPEPTQAPEAPEATPAPQATQATQAPGDIPPGDPPATSQRAEQD